MQITATLAAAISVVLGIWFLAVRLVTESFRRRMVSVPPVYPDAAYPPVTVVVPFRNEQGNLPALIRALKQQDYKGPLEIIFSDDHSTDGSSQIAEQAGFRLVRLPDNRKGKKAALDFAIRQSFDAEDDRALIITTDADVIPGSSWISIMVSEFSDDSIKMVLGPVTIRPDGWWNRLQAMEFAPVMAVTAVAAAAGTPLMANGANLAFRRKDFLAVEGYSGNEHIASGDDQFLLSKFQNRWPGCVRFAFEQGAVVGTAGQPAWRELLRQRVRWAGKWRKTGSKALMITAIFIFAVQLATLALVPLFFIGGFETLLLLLPVRWIAEYFLIRTTGRFLGFTVPFHEFVFLTMVYPFYVAAVAFGSIGARSIWKGRNV